MKVDFGMLYSGLLEQVVIYGQDASIRMTQKVQLPQLSHTCTGFEIILYGKPALQTFRFREEQAEGWT